MRIILTRIIANILITIIISIRTIPILLIIIIIYIIAFIIFLTFPSILVSLVVGISLYLYIPIYECISGVLTWLMNCGTRACARFLSSLFGNLQPGTILARE